MWASMINCVKCKTKKFNVYEKPYDQSKRNSSVPSQIKHLENHSIY